MICAMNLIGDLGEIQAKKYIALSRTYALENKGVDIKLKNYAENYRFTRGKDECIRLID